MARKVLVPGFAAASLLAFGWVLEAALPLPGEEDVRAEIPPGLAGERMLGRGADFGLDCRSMVFELADGLAHTLRRDEASAATGLPVTVGGRTYGGWSPTPVDPESREEWSVNGSVWQGLGCGLPRGLADTSREIAAAPGGFYTFGRDRLLLVDPSRNLLVYVHRRTLPR